MKFPVGIAFRSLVERRHGGVMLFVCLFVGVATLTRIALLLKAAHSVSFDSSLLASFGWGFLYDLGAALLFSLPATLALAVLPAGFFDRLWARFLAQAFLFFAVGLLLFGAIAEWLFWDEFSARFNFIAVDYLVYTTEVVANIRESYPMPWIFAGILAGAAVIYGLLARTGWIGRWLDDAHEPARARWRTGFGWIAAAVIAGFALNADQLPSFANNYNRELAKDGVWSLFAAFRNNELEYDQFYTTLPPDRAFQTLHQEFAHDGSTPLAGAAHDTLRLIRNEGPEFHPNIIQVTVESLSAEFLSIFDPKSTLTPNLEEIARKSLVFDKLFATGTRTDRGMEALTLSLPPTPGRSLVKRPRNENLFTLGSVLRSRGYDTAFVYGGYGYFDNMNYFFGHNGYRIVDRASVDAKDITFANAWGACDEDLFRWALRDADATYAQGKPFFQFIMTTSNHRPFTFPDGRIDLPSKTSGRSGGVKYTDYAIGKLIRDAESKPWFKNTVFVIVADHCAEVAGKTELPVQNYHIPLIIYAPGGQLPTGRVPDLMSQVDYAPTLLGLLNWSYASRFYGWDVRKSKGERRALIGNYQRLGLYEDKLLTVLRPVRGVSQLRYESLKAPPVLVPPEPATVDRAVAYYQTASILYGNGGYRELSPDEQKRYLSQADRTPQDRRPEELAAAPSLPAGSPAP